MNFRVTRAAGRIGGRVLPVPQWMRSFARLHRALDPKQLSESAKPSPFGITSDSWRVPLRIPLLSSDGQLLRQNGSTTSSDEFPV